MSAESGALPTVRKPAVGVAHDKEADAVKGIPVLRLQEYTGVAEIGVDDVFVRPTEAQLLQPRYRSWRLAGCVNVEVAFDVVGATIGSRPNTTDPVRDGQWILNRRIVACGDIGQAFHIPTYDMLQQAARLNECLRSLKRVRIVAVQRIGNAFTPVGIEIPAHRTRQGAGGEEFGVLLRGEAAFEKMAETFREQVSRLRIGTSDGEHVALTVSLGLARFQPERHGDGDALYAAADAALYRAKQAGRNRLELA